MDINSSKNQTSVELWGQDACSHQEVKSTEKVEKVLQSWNQGNPHLTPKPFTMH